jgi:hypothetical protein
MQYVEHKILTTKTAKRKSFPRWERQSAKADAKADLARRFGLLMRSDFAASQGRRVRPPYAENRMHGGAGGVAGAIGWRAESTTIGASVLFKSA